MYTEAMYLVYSKIWQGKSVIYGKIWQECFLFFCLNYYLYHISYTGS